MKNKFALLMTPRTIIALLVMTTICFQAIITKSVDTILAGFGGAIMAHYYNDKKEQEKGSDKND